MLQASFLDCLFLDFLSQFQDFCASAVIHIERRQIVQALVVTMVVVVIDEGFDLPLQITWQGIVLQKNTVLHGLVPALNLALGPIHFVTEGPTGTGQTGRAEIRQHPLRHVAHACRHHDCTI